MSVENISQQFRLKNIEEIKNYFIKEIDQNEMMRKRHKNLFTILKYIEYFVISAFSISAFASLLGIIIGITCSAMG